MNVWKYLPILFLTIGLSYCGSPVHFDESKWRRDVEKQSIEKLYAPHFKNGRYFNPWMPSKNGRFWKFLKWRLSGKGHYTDEEMTFKPDIDPNLSNRIKALSNVDFISWIGHNTFLIRIQGEYWLTDPIFSKRAFIPKRVTPPAITSDELKEITDRVNVIISHNHYDHLDAKTIRSLPEKSHIFVPKGLKGYISSIKSCHIEELDWWEGLDLKGGIKLVCLPAQHWSRRIGQPVNSTLWASFMLLSPRANIYFGGDSGYFAGYKEIGRQFSDITYALIPLTAYHPRWFMHYAHMNAKESIDAFRELGARYFIPTQWGTFNLGGNPPGYPALDLKRLIKEMNLDASKFLIMDIGEIKVINSHNHLNTKFSITPGRPQIHIDEHR
jgi:N-acyl-phosphatidylethanolamine-hydrolysing phospholipase D